MCFRTSKRRFANFWSVMATLWQVALPWRNKIPFESLPQCLETSCSFSLLRSATKYFAVTVAPFSRQSTCKISSLSQHTYAKTLLDDVTVLNFFGHGEPLCIHSLDCSLVSGSYIYMDSSLIHSCELVQEFQRIQLKLVQNGLCSKHSSTLLTRIENWEPTWLRAFSCLKSLQEHSLLHLGISPRSLLSF
jgi:hypothetical protein